MPTESLSSRPTQRTVRFLSKAIDWFSARGGSPKKWDAVTERSRVWQRQRFTEGDHEHCLLTWETIYPGDDAYRSDAGEWISIHAYERFVRDDVLRVRS